MNDALQIYKSDNKTFEVTTSKLSGGVVNLAGATLKFTVKENETDTQANAKIKKTSAQAAEILITDAAAGVFQVYILPADTSSLDVKRYYYDIEITPSSGKVYTGSKGTFDILQEITTT